MQPVTVYTKSFCPYCDRALALLSRKGVQPAVINAERDPGLRSEMVARSGGRNTFPQIFIGEVHVGGCDDLHALDAAGRLDPMLTGA